MRMDLRSGINSHVTKSKTFPGINGVARVNHTLNPGGINYDDVLCSEVSFFSRKFEMTMAAKIPTVAETIQYAVGAAANNFNPLIGPTISAIAHVRPAMH